MKVMRIVLLIANGVWLPVFVVGNVSRVYLFATTSNEYFASVLLPVAISTVVCTLILVGNIAYIWRSRPHAHNERGASASHAPAPRG